MSSQPNSAQLNNTSVLGVLSATVTALGTTVITTAVKSTTLIDKSMNVLIHGVSAAEHIADAGEKRAKIYSDAIVKNGDLAEREGVVRAKLRLIALEKQEAATGATKPKRRVTRKKKAAVRKVAAKK